MSVEVGERQAAVDIDIVCYYGHSIVETADAIRQNVIERIEGLRCIDCGKLELSRITESLTALLISVNARHKTHAGIKLARVPDEQWD